MSSLLFFRVVPLALVASGLFLITPTMADRPVNSEFGESALNFSDPRYQRAMIAPTLVHLDTGEQRKFTVSMVATRLMAAEVPEKIVWSVNDIPGGNETIGTIDEKGLYTAPAAMPSPREINIVAEVPQAANPFSFATVIIGDDPIVYKPVHIWTETRNGEGANLSTPHGIGLDKDENILIADMGNSKIHRFTQTGEFINNIGLGKGREDGYISDPREVTSDTDGRIFVTDSKGDRPRVQVFSNEGEFLQIFGEKGRLPGMILRAHGMDHDRARNLFIVDVDNMRVSVYDQFGKWLRDFGTEGLLPGEMNAPHGLFVDRSGDVFVTGYYGPTQKFNGYGDFVTAFAHGMPPEGPSYFHNVAGDKWGNAYVSVRNKGGYDGAIQHGDEGYYSVMKYNNHGDFICGWAYSASDHSESSVAVAEDGRVFCLFNGREESGVETFAQE